MSIKWIKLNNVPKPVCNLFIFHHSGKDYYYILLYIIIIITLLLYKSI